jgi:hypothetical protein
MTKLATLLFVSVFAVGCSAGAADDAGSESTALAAARTPIALDGEFRAMGHVEALGRLTVDVVDTRSPDADARLAQLRSDGAACTAVMANTWRCTMMHPASEVPQASLDAIAARNHDVFAKLGGVWASPSVTSEGESVTDWQIGQKGECQAGAFETYRYLELGGDLVKIVLPAERASVELIVKDQQRLAKWDSKVVTESRWRWHEDAALVILEKR